MKTLKTKMLTALVLVSLCVAGFTVKSENEKSIVVENAGVYAWFLYIGPHPGTLSDLLNPNNYTRYYGSPFTMCFGNEKLCAIWAEEVNGAGSPKPYLNATDTGNVGFHLYMYYYVGSTGSADIRLKSDE